MRKCSDSHEFQLGVPPRVYEGDESFLVSRVFPENHNRPREIDIYIYIFVLSPFAPFLWLFQLRFPGCAELRHEVFT